VNLCRNLFRSDNVSSNAIFEVNSDVLARKCLLSVMSFLDYVVTWRPLETARDGNRSSDVAKDTQIGV
jgi:hypothetical protein